MADHLSGLPEYLTNERLIRLAKHLLDVEGLGSLGPQTETVITLMGIQLLKAAEHEPNPVFKADMLLYAHGLILVGQITFAHNAAVIDRFRQLLEAERG